MQFGSLHQNFIIAKHVRIKWERKNQSWHDIQKQFSSTCPEWWWCAAQASIQVCSTKQPTGVQHKADHRSAHSLTSKYKQVMPQLLTENAKMIQKQISQRNICICLSVHSLRHKPPPGPGCGDPVTQHPAGNEATTQATVELQTCEVTLPDTKGKVTGQGKGTELTLREALVPKGQGRTQYSCVMSSCHWEDSLQGMLG